MVTYLPTLPILAVGYRFQGLFTAYRFYRPILPHFKLSAHKDKNTYRPKSTPTTIKTFQKLHKLNAETVAGMQEIPHNKNSGRGGGMGGTPSAHPGACILQTLTWYSSSTSFLEYQAGEGKGLVDLRQSADS